MPALSHDAVPVFKLYGETRHWPTPDLLHCESIAERSRLHDWHIKTHRHADLLHLLHIAAGEVVLDLEGTQTRFCGPALIVVPAMAIHGFHFEQQIRGHIITLAQPLAEHLIVALSHQGAALQRSGHYRLVDSGEAQTIALLVAQIADEYRRPAINRDLVLHALIQALAAQVARRAERQRSHPPALRPTPSTSERARSHLQRFQALIEAHYREQPTVGALAKQLGITAAHLNTLCRQLADRSALQLLHERILLEAKRQLTYTNMTISEVADSLGFSEPAYFTRFFKRLTGLNPRDFRMRQHAPC
ncbi:helix-turn-helix domain-containing protein [Halomonas salipaludis]|uniref:AraC family transcriptional regulator n=1 Tax=Halomonas salipaludis TaxID=2032625 RepID=A0A2A2EQX0_9GAMM|nr:helix-turn-helix domain-containing protein [Halomonas salipaludis]PAU74795.1 AraC family transcriptional regulator [Halomonas salipaludis]